MPFYFVVFGAGLIAGFINIMAGGGSLITLPVLLFLGLPAPLANGTNRISILIQNVVAVESFRRQHIWNPMTGIKLAAVTLPGAVLGAFVSLRIPEQWFRGLLAAVLVLAVVAMLVPRSREPGTSDDRPDITWPGYLAFVGIGFYGGFIQAGVGMLFLVVLYQFMRVSLVWVNMYKVLAIGVYTIPALVVFAASDNVDWITGAVMGGGSATGAFVATHVSVKGGDRVIRLFVAVVLVLMAVRLVVAL